MKKTPGVYDCQAFGLYRTTVGNDTGKNDFLENIILYQEPVPESVIDSSVPDEIVESSSIDSAIETIGNDIGKISALKIIIASLGFLVLVFVSIILVIIKTKNKNRI